MPKPLLPEFDESKLAPKQRKIVDLARRNRVPFSLNLDELRTSLGSHDAKELASSLREIRNLDKADFLKQQK